MKSFSFIIVGRSEEECTPALKALDKLDYPSDHFEILLSIGNNPSLQRNQAALVAEGDYIVFLDNDSQVSPRLLHYYLDAFNHFDDPDVIGGPSIFLSERPVFLHAVHLVFSSVFGLGPSKSRYSPVGPVRKGGQKDLILCNMCIKRDLFIKTSGFNVKLYPNEENEYLNRIGSDALVIYHPLAIVEREPRRNLLSFAKQMVTYGIGRTKHYLLSPSFFSAIYYIPAAFSLTVLVTLIMLLSGISIPLFIKLGFFFYLILSLSASMFCISSSSSIAAFPYLPVLFFICHFCYGIGLIAGGIVPLLKIFNLKKDRDFYFAITHKKYFDFDTENTTQPISKFDAAA